MKTKRLNYLKVIVAFLLALVILLGLLQPLVGLEIDLLAFADVKTKYELESSSGDFINYSDTISNKDFAGVAGASGNIILDGASVGALGKVYSMEFKVVPPVGEYKVSVRAKNYIDKGIFEMKIADQIVGIFNNGEDSIWHTYDMANTIVITENTANLMLQFKATDSTSGKYGFGLDYITLEKVEGGGEITPIPVPIPEGAVSYDVTSEGYIELDPTAWVAGKLLNYDLTTATKYTVGNTSASWSLYPPENILAGEMANF